MLIPILKDSLNSFIVFMIVMTLVMITVLLLYYISLVLDDKEFKITRINKKKKEIEIMKNKMIESEKKENNN